mmetsp:Transcript_36363/g.58294  ORF Transcript_36363/g.58294 Transcript_36363/m.58294 type:complete len:311 (+) Transcript_36363:174-1106(+)
MENLFALIGGVVVLKAALLLGFFMFKRSARPVKDPKSYGSWVAITGATDGIGKALCFEFAKKGMNVFLISRTESKLKSTCEEIESQYPDVSTDYLPVDYSDFNQLAQKRVSDAFKKLDKLGILVNNVGMSYPFPMYFHELSDNELHGLLELNVNATTWMTRIALPIMLENKKGAILNIGSAAGLHPNPLLAIYSATKSYVETMSHSLNTEYSPKGISVQCHVPLFIVSKLSKYKRSSFFVPSTETYAKDALATLGYDPVVSPYFMHHLASSFLDLLPEPLIQWASLRFHLGIRSKGMRKRAREAEGKKSN